MSESGAEGTLQVAVEVRYPNGAPSEDVTTDAEQAKLSPNARDFTQSVQDLGQSDDVSQR
ncbi:hypothetical protein [Nocardia aurea]|uniref:hypothetical protein n=1 Tax=Nocardia aurea TaxID=2144174 RepID=UPI0033B264A8